MEPIITATAKAAKDPTAVSLDQLLKLPIYGLVQHWSNNPQVREILAK